MIITQQNDRLYDSSNFDSYKNFYAIRYDVEKYHIMKEKNHADSFSIYIQHFNTQLILSVDTTIEKSNSIFDIVYGHFYNDQNFFLFKKVHNGKIIGYKVSKCNKGELYHNKLNQLYISNYFGEAKKTVLLLNNEANADIANESTCPALSYIVYDKQNEKLSFITLWTDEYNNETEILEIIIHNPYEIKPI